MNRAVSWCGSPGRSRWRGTLAVWAPHAARVELVLMTGEQRCGYTMTGRSLATLVRPFPPSRKDSAMSIAWTAGQSS